MSRLFDALQNALAAGNGAEIEAVFSGGQNGTSTLPAAAPPAPSEARPPEVAAAATAAATKEAAPPQEAYRCVKLHMQAGVPALPFDGSASQAAEQYRMIRTRIVHDQRQPRICMVSSPTPGDGKTITAINIAASLVLKSGVSALLVDCDLRRAGVAATLGIDLEPGLAGVLEGVCPLQKAIVQIEEFPGLYVLPAGTARANPTELLDSAAWRALCASAKQSFQYVVLDSCPVGSVADHELVQASADSVIIVMRPDHTNRALSIKAVESVPKEKLLGVVVNCAKRWFLHRAPAPYYQYAEYR